MLQTAAYSLLGSGIVAAGLAILSLLFGARRDLYLAGLVAAFAAFLIALPTGMALRAIFPQGAPVPLLPLIDPAIEEPLRILILALGASALAESQRTTGAAIAFAFGYALFESVAKALDALIAYSQTFSTDQLAVLLSAPLVVLLLHLTLSLLAAVMFAKGARIRAVLLTTFALHAAHNASVFWLPPPTDLGTLALANLARIAVFAAAIHYCLSSLRIRDMLRAASA